MSSKVQFTDDSLIDRETRWHPRVSIISLPPQSEEEYRRHPSYYPGRLVALDRIMFLEKPLKGQTPTFDYKGATYPEAKRGSARPPALGVPMDAVYDNPSVLQGAENQLLAALGRPSIVVYMRVRDGAMSVLSGAKSLTLCLR